MVNWIEPRYSKSQINNAGNRLRSGVDSLDDLSVLEDWRASHAYIINTFQANLRRRAKEHGALVGQRLKRRLTILDKLQRQPKMMLARMHDVAGCRVIFNSVDDLFDFRAKMFEARFKHRRTNANRDQFNYLETPKQSGYRGVHDVYSYSATSAAGTPWNGLLLEIQYRTKVQHAWATAVETADLLTKSRVKFSDGAESYQRFFRVCSEMLARVFEASNAADPNISSHLLIEEFKDLEASCNILRLLKGANRVTPKNLKGHIQKGKNVVLVYPYTPVDNIALYVNSFYNHKMAISYYQSMEDEWKERADVVLVSSDDAEGIMFVFQNYFQDTRFFNKSIERAARLLS